MSFDSANELVLKDLQFGYQRPLLPDALNLKVPQSQLIMLLGSNGTGKSTLIKTMGGLLKPVSGEILLGNKAVNKLSTELLVKTFSFVFPGRPQIDFCTVKDIALTGRYPYIPAFHSPSETDLSLAENAMNTMSITHLSNNTIDQLSDGEFQKTMIARALTQEATFLFLDEPTAFLDFKSKQDLFTVLRSLAENESKTIIISTHEPHLAYDFGDQFWIIHNNQLIVTEDKDEMRVLII